MCVLQITRYTYIKGSIIEAVIFRELERHLCFTFGRFSVCYKENLHVTSLEACGVESSARAHATYVTGPPFCLNSFSC
jgi:hypothetical protein